MVNGAMRVRNGAAAWMVAVGVAASVFSTAASAAGAVAMQIESLVRQAVAEYNSAMEEGDSAAFVKYFSSGAKLESPLFNLSGRADLARHFAAEFKTYDARYRVKKMFVQDNQAAIVMTWEAVDRKSGDALKLDMMGLFEVGSSGQFSSAIYYYDPAQAKGLENLGK
jgi:hypothetical protein